MDFVYNFQIHGIEWELQIVNPEDIEGLGECDYWNYEIKIKSGFKNNQLMRVLRHELTHAFRWSYGNVSEMELSNYPTEEIQEIICNTVEVHGENIIKLSKEIHNALLKGGYFANEKN